MSENNGIIGCCDEILAVLTKMTRCGYRRAIGVEALAGAAEYEIKLLKARCNERRQTTEESSGQTD
jgi:hypothetical protein